MRITSITPMKNEGPYLLEWVAYHRMIGFNDMLVFTNDCTDGSDQMLERLDEMGLLRHMPNPSVTHVNARHHRVLIGYENKMARLRRSDWVTNIDADEFVRVKVGGGKMEDLFAALPDAHGISLCLPHFGANGQDDIAEEGKLLTERFTRRGPDEEPFQPTKFFVRGDFPWKSFDNNSVRLQPEDFERVNFYNGSGRRLSRETLEAGYQRLEGDEVGGDLADVAHYAVRGFRSFLTARDRGNANPVKGIPEEDLHVRKAIVYFDKFDRNDVEDRWIDPIAADVRAAVAELLQDPELAQLQEATVAWHRARAQELIETNWRYERLYDRIRPRHFERLNGTPPEDMSDEGEDEAAPMQAHG